MLEIEVQGARQVRETMPEAVQVFIAPPSRGGAARRGSSAAAPTRPRRSSARLATAREELARPATSSRHVVVNDRLEDAVDELEELRPRRRCSATESLTALDGGSDLDLSPRRPLLEHVDSPYASVIVAAKRARQINSYYHNLGEGTFEEFPPPMVDTALQELPHDRARGSRERQDQVPLPRLSRAARWRASSSA